MADSASASGANAVTLRDRIAAGALKAVDVANAYLDVIRQADDDIQAWAWFDQDFVIHQAKALDAYRAQGQPLGKLHGLPVAVKDIIDTARIPTENGTEIDAGRVPEADAAVVERLKAAGAIIMGKSVTTELALFHPGKTRNPVNIEHTPGGSSQGSAAAVAAGMVPLAIGTQTAGSVIRPASFCGVAGYKPTFGAISRRGILAQAPSLDTVGVFAADPAGAALLADALFGHDPADAATMVAPPPRLLETASSKAPVRPTFAFMQTPYWHSANTDLQTALGELVEMLGENCFQAELPPELNGADQARQSIQFAELAKCYYTYGKRGQHLLSDAMKTAMERGNSIPARDYISALDWKGLLGAVLDSILSRCDAILTPAAPGPAPRGLETTGDPVFNGIWTLSGLPTVTIPIFQTEAGLPMGVQLVGRRWEDGRLLRTARWLAEFVDTQAQED
jgi:Asp-tRNA(Asn)/Glu-tRNA(Gln) amidotransferase A subunit family amidase